MLKQFTPKRPASQRTTSQWIASQRIKVKVSELPLPESTILNRRLMQFITAVLLVSYFPVALASALIEQTFTLNPGWNAIYLEINPDDGNPETTEDRAPASVFKLASQSDDIATVWAHPSTSTTAQFIRNPSEEGFNDGGWRVYIADTGGSANASFLTNLHAIIPHQVYLVKLNGTESKQLTVTGTPHYQPIRWQPDAFNLVGFYVDPGQPETFANLLGLTTQQNPDIYALDNGSSWQKLPQGKNSIVDPGKGYWIFNDGSINQSGPFELSANQRSGLVFNGDIAIKSLGLTLRSTLGNGSVTLNVSDTFPLQYFAGFNATPGVEGNTAQWSDVDNHQFLLNRGVPNNLLLGVDRTALATQLDSVLTIRGFGSRVRLPLAAQPAQSATGLWAGVAILDQVSHAAGDDTEALQSTPAPMQVKLLLHVDHNEQVRLLKQVYLLGNEEADEGEDAAVLITNDTCLSQYQPLNLTRREGVGYRLTSSVFDSAETSIELGALSGNMTGSLLITPDLNTHPMKHRFHMNHDDLDASTGSPIIGDEPEQAFHDEVWTIERVISLQRDPLPMPSPDNGIGRMSGTYGERISGMHKQSIYVQGQFSAQRLNRVGTLIEDCSI